MMEEITKISENASQAAVQIIWTAAKFIVNTYIFWYPSNKLQPVKCQK